MNNASTDSQSSPQVFYEVAMNRLDAQMNRMETIVASLIGFASAIIAGIVKGCRSIERFGQSCITSTQNNYLSHALIG